MLVRCKIGDRSNFYIILSTAHHLSLRAIILKLAIEEKAVPSTTPPPSLPLSLLEVASRARPGHASRGFPQWVKQHQSARRQNCLRDYVIRRDIEWDFVDALAAVKLDTAVYQSFKERWRDVARHVLGLNRTIRVGAGLTEMKRLGVAVLQPMLTFGNQVHLAKMCTEGLEMFLWWTKTVLVGGLSTCLAWKVGLLKLPLGGVIWVYRDLVDKEGYTIPGLPSSFKNTTGMAKGSAICAIGMVKVPFVINLKFSRAVECKNILKLPRPTLSWIVELCFGDWKKADEVCNKTSQNCLSTLNCFWLSMVLNDLNRSDVFEAFEFFPIDLYIMGRSLNWPDLWTLIQKIWDLQVIGTW